MRNNMNLKKSLGYKQNSKALWFTFFLYLSSWAECHLRKFDVRCFVYRICHVTNHYLEVLAKLYRSVGPDNEDVIFAYCSEVVKQELESLYEMRKVKAAVTIQCWVRRWICYKRWPSLKRSLELQKKARHGNKVNHKWVVWYRLSST